MSRQVVRLTIAYQGTRYHGWQVQPGRDTIQQRLEQALQHYCPSAGRIHGSGRTDAGVHALGMVAHVRIPEAELSLEPRRLRLALNHRLPEDIRIVEVARAEPGFHARFDCRRKQYRYLIWNHPAANPLLRHAAWHVPSPLDRERMRESARRLVGRHDFRSLACHTGYAVKNAVRELHRCEVLGEEELITLVMEGDGFLYKMCRSIAGLLHQAGRGKRSPEEMPKLLGDRNRSHGGVTAPAHGLVLHSVSYGQKD